MDFKALAEHAGSSQPGRHSKPFQAPSRMRSTNGPAIRRSVLLSSLESDLITFSRRFRGVFHRNAIENGPKPDPKALEEAVDAMVSRTRGVSPATALELRMAALAVR